MLEHITESLAAEVAAHAVTPEQVRAVLHPRLDVYVPVFYRSRDEILEAEALRTERSGL